MLAAKARSSPCPRPPSALRPPSPRPCARTCCRTLKSNAVFTIGNVDSNSAVSGIAQAGKTGQVKVCGMNFDESILNNIKNGSQACAIDQQGYHQGYLAVSILNGFVNYGLTVPTREILTRPGRYRRLHRRRHVGRRESGHPLPAKCLFETGAARPVRAA